MCTAACPRLADRDDTVIDKPNPPATLRTPIVATERGPRGGYLSFVGSDGARVANLTHSGLVTIRDQGATWSPDGRWIAFHSSRGRDSLIETSLWIIEARTNAKPRRLTFSRQIDRHPTWLDANHLVYVSQQRGHSSNIWKAKLHLGPHGPSIQDAPVQLTRSVHNDESPSVSPNGKTVAFMRVDVDQKTIDNLDHKHGWHKRNATHPGPRRCHASLGAKPPLSHRIRRTGREAGRL